MEVEQSIAAEQPRGEAQRNQDRDRAALAVAQGAFADHQQQPHQQAALDHAPDPADAGRERVMAFHLRQLLADHERVLFVCGMSHARRVHALMTGPTEGEPLRRVRREASQSQSEEVSPDDE